MQNTIYHKNQSECFPSVSDPKKKKTKLDFNKIKKNTFKSLNEVECFLNDFHKFFNCMKLYKILK